MVKPITTTTTTKPKKQSKVPPAPQVSRKQSQKTEVTKEKVVTENIVSRKSSQKTENKKSVVPESSIAPVKLPKETEVTKEPIVNETVDNIEAKHIENQDSDNSKSQSIECEVFDHYSKEEDLIPPLFINESASEFVDSTVAGVDSESFKEGTIELINILRNNETPSPLPSYITSYDDQYVTTLPPPVMQTLEYEVIHATGWDESYPPQQLLPKDNKNNGNNGGIKHGKGWQSARYSFCFCFSNAPL
ncbi:7594_t:CDS:1 [Acaulospora morrowiae]|uniref:7594_t:CDS:1 n=1 Tax=Acaulospora morrowiae TaxID=94023 RepID=A0A9N8V7H7_9GLOM|nr:7594_t:CDS:1 [Acaulospora morrowiae]